MGALSAMFCLMAILLLIGMIGGKEVEDRKNFTIAFCVLVLAITALALKFA